MRPEMRKVVWNICNIHTKGYFHQFGNNIAETNENVCQYSIAIVEDENGKVHLVIPENIKFEDWQ